MEGGICKVIRFFMSPLKYITPVFRLGQEPPPPQQEDSYDGRSLAEVSKVISTPTSCRIHFFLLVAMRSRNLQRTRSESSFSALPSTY